jgi:hypothetical protein
MKPFVFLWLIAALPALAGAQSFPDAPLPEILAGAGDLLQVSHYPDPVKASRDADEPGTWFWKHTTTVFSPDQNIRIRNAGLTFSTTSSGICVLNSTANNLPTGSIARKER